MLDDPQSFGEFQLSYRTGDIVSPAMPPSEPLRLEMEDFCNAIRTGAEPLSSADLGVEVVRMIEAVDASLSASGSRVAVSSSPHSWPDRRRDPDVLSPLEIAAGVPLPEREPRTRLERTDLAPRAALDQAILSGLQRAPCVVSFSGGRDSSLVLAAAVDAARRHGLPLPVPVTRPGRR